MEELERLIAKSIEEAPLQYGARSWPSRRPSRLQSALTTFLSDGGHWRHCRAPAATRRAAEVAALVLFRIKFFGRACPVARQRVEFVALDILSLVIPIRLRVCLCAFR
jgi:hypothetical protein